MINVKERIEMEGDFVETRGFKMLIGCQSRVKSRVNRRAIVNSDNY